MRREIEGGIAVAMASSISMSLAAPEGGGEMDIQFDRRCFNGFFVTHHAASARCLNPSSGRSRSDRRVRP